MRIVALLAGLLALAGCATSTRRLPAVGGFELDRYLGVWYEAARFPHLFETGLTEVSADYTLQPDGTVRVVNRGYDAATDRWKSATGRAHFAGPHSQGLLRVSFFRPFYGDYKIVDLDRDGYTWAVVTSGTYDYLWILTRDPRPDAATVDRLTRVAREKGFDVSRLLRIDQSRNAARPAAAPAPPK